MVKTSPADSNDRSLRVLVFHGCFTHLAIWRSAQVLKRKRRAIFGALALILYSGLMALHTKASDLNSDESQLRAAIIHGILHYTDWRREVSGGFCILGDAPSATPLGEAAQQLRINHSPVEVRVLGDQANLQGCDVLVIGALSASENHRLSQNLDSIQLLSICDNCDHTTLNTNIQLKVVNDRIGFDIVMRLNDNSYVNYRSQLLELAGSINEESKIR